MNPTSRSQLIDLAERAVWTFVQAFLGVWIALEGASPDELFTLANLQVAAVAGLMSVIKSVAAFAQDRNTPALPPSYQHSPASTDN